MPKIARLGDGIDHGGAIIEGSDNSFANNLKIARIGDAVVCDVHDVQVIVEGSPNSFANDRKIARVGDHVSCGASITEGSPNSFANN